MACPGAQDIVAFQHACEVAGALCEPPENQGAVAAGFVPGGPDGAFKGFDGTAGPDHEEFRAEFLRELGL
jgi:hypothetical protein